MNVKVNCRNCLVLTRVIDYLYLHKYFNFNYDKNN